MFDLWDFRLDSSLAKQNASRCGRRACGGLRVYALRSSRGGDGAVGAAHSQARGNSFGARRWRWRSARRAAWPGGAPSARRAAWLGGAPPARRAAWLGGAPSARPAAWLSGAPPARPADWHSGAPPRRAAWLGGAPGHGGQPRWVARRDAGNDPRGPTNRDGRGARARTDGRRPAGRHV